MDFSFPSDAPGSDGLRHGVCSLVLSLGRSEFAHRFATECDTLFQADQITAFLVEEGRARCILAHRPEAQQVVLSLTRAYTRNFVRFDPLLAASAQRGVNFAASRLAGADIADDAYRFRFFHNVGLKSKIAAIAQHDNRTIYMNFYFRNSASETASALARLNLYGPLLAACLHKHESLTGASFQAGAARARVERFLADRFPSLSRRESEVAAAISCGLSTEAIALELGIASSSVITFRRRAYAKMAIGSRGELFAQVAGLSI